VSIRKGLVIAVVVLSTDAGISSLATYVGLLQKPLVMLGDLLLLEVGLFAILGGLVEFSRSKGIYELRRLTQRSSERFSITRHREASITAVMLFCVALVLFAVLVVLALIE
jgi:hypothetical protein